MANCPKCGTLLIKYNDRFYFCIGCSLSGSLIEINKQAVAIKRRLEEKERKVQCHICGRLEKVSKIRSVTRNGRSMFVCQNC